MNKELIHISQKDRVFNYQLFEEIAGEYGQKRRRKFQKKVFANLLGVTKYLRRCVSKGFLAHGPEISPHHNYWKCIQNLLQNRTRYKNQKIKMKAGLICAALAFFSVSSQTLGRFGQNSEQRQARIQEFNDFFASNPSQAEIQAFQLALQAERAQRAEQHRAERQARLNELVTFFDGNPTQAEIDAKRAEILANRPERPTRPEGFQRPTRPEGFQRPTLPEGFERPQRGQGNLRGNFEGQNPLEGVENSEQIREFLQSLRP